MLTMDISQRYINFNFTDRHTLWLVQLKSVDMSLHVTAGKLICAANNPHWVVIGISLH